MKRSNTLIAISLIAVLPLAAIAGDKDKTPSPMGTTTSAQFDKLDTDRDGRISKSEAASDARIVFSSADKDGNGYLDNSEYSQREMSQESVPNSVDQTTDAVKPR